METFSSSLHAGCMIATRKPSMSEGRRRLRADCGPLATALLEILTGGILRVALSNSGA